MRNLKKYFGFSYNLNIDNIKFITKSRNSCGDDALENSLNVIIATKTSVYSYSFFNNQSTLLFNISDNLEFPVEEVNISGIIYDDITESIIVCLQSGEIVSFQLDNDIVVGSNHLTTIPGGIDFAEWSPDREIVLTVNSSSIFLLSATYYDVLIEVNPASDTLGKTAQVNVGWGKKETQFHGSEGKAAAKKVKIVVDSSLIKDDHKTHVSWRGDSLLFSVSYWDVPRSQRFIKMFDKSGSLLAINEELSGITGPISWRPFGDLLAFSERTPDNYAVGFLEKNGLKHGEFNVPADLKVKKVMWNNDSSILALVCLEETSGCECILLWTTCNYHWYLKQKIVFKCPLECLLWDDIRGNRLYGVCQDGFAFTAEWITTVDSNREWCLGSDSGYVAVIDNDNILLNAFKEAIVPPPMSRWSLKCDDVINSILFPSWSNLQVSSEDSHTLCTVSHNNKFVIWKRDGQQFLISESLTLPVDKGAYVDLKASLNLWVWFRPESFATIQTITGTKSILTIYTRDNNDFTIFSKEVPFCAITLNYFSKAFLIQSSTGVLFQINEDTFELVESQKLPEPCLRLEFYSDGIYALSEKSRLYKDTEQIGSQINSFLLHGSFLLATTSLHTLVIFRNSFDKCNEISKRKLENGSRLVVASQTTVIFQLPRGNLEAIQPRALTIETAGRLLTCKKFKEAVALLSRQRIDLNLAVDHDSDHFLTSADEFVNQVEPKWLTLLITELKPESVTSTLYSDFYEKNHPVLSPDIKVEKVCKTLYSSMVKNQEKFILPIMGTLVKTGSMSEALKLAVTEDSLQHLLFLVDVDKLYNEALLAYNLEAALRIAGKSQKDPKEYLPYLNKLRSMEPNYMKYTIAKTLGKPDSALKHIALCEGDDKFNECLQLVKDNVLYSASLKLFPQNSSKYNVLAELYGDHLSSLKRYEEAGLMYRRSGATKKAIDAYLKVGEWRLCLELSNQSGYNDKEKDALVQTLRGVLKGMQKYNEAGALCLEVLQDVQACINMLLLGKLWKEAIRVAKYKAQQSVFDIQIKRSLLDHAETLSGEIKSSTENFRKHLQRLKIVRENKNKNVEPSLAEPWDAQSDTSSVSSLRTSHSSASRSSKNTRKTIRKMWSLKEGNPREEQALVSTLATLIEASEKLSSEVQTTCFSLLELNCDEIASEIQFYYKLLLDLIVKSKSIIWPRDPDVDEITLIDERLKIPPQSGIQQGWELEILKP